MIGHEISADFHWPKAVNGYVILSDTDISQGPWLAPKDEWEVRRSAGPEHKQYQWPTDKISNDERELLTLIRKHMDYGRMSVSKENGQIAMIHIMGGKPLAIPYQEVPPLRSPILHRNFAALKTPADIVAFANRNGLLMSNQCDYSHNPAYGVSGESLSWWRKVSEEMACLVRIWDLVSRHHTSALVKLVVPRRDYRTEIGLKWCNVPGAELVKWHGDAEPLDFRDPDNEQQDDDGYHRSVFLKGDWNQRWNRDPVILFRHFLCGEVNGHLRHITPQLNPERVRDMTFRPRTLQDVLWLLFSLEIQGRSNIRLCKYENCGKPFTFDRKDKVYCSKNCSQNAQYHRDPFKYRGKRNKEA